MCNESELRVIDTTDDFTGRVQICSPQGFYETLCGSSIEPSVARVICRQLGLDPEGNSTIKYNEETGNGNQLYTVAVLDIFTFDSSGYSISPRRYFCNDDSQSLSECNFFNTDCFDNSELGLQCGAPLRECEDDQVLCRSEDRCLPSSFLCDGYPDCSDLSDEARPLCDRE